MDFIRIIFVRIVLLNTLSMLIKSLKICTSKIKLQNTNDGQASKMSLPDNFVVIIHEDHLLVKWNTTKISNEKHWSNYELQVRGPKNSTL